MSLKAYDVKPEYWTRRFLDLNTKNFNQWDTKLRAYLRPIEAVWTLYEPEDEEEEKAQAIRQYVLSLIQLNLDETHLQMSSKATSPERLYTLLRGQARPTNAVSRHNAKLNYLSLRHEADPSIVAFAKRLENEALELNQLTDPDHPVITDDDRLLTLRASTVRARVGTLRRPARVRPYLGQL